MKYKGFKHSGKTYVWREGELYRLPYTAHFRSFGLLKCKRWNDGYILGADRKSGSQLIAMTTEIESDFEFQKNNDTPF
jgi:hypothetical protein